MAGFHVSINGRFWVSPEVFDTMVESRRIRPEALDGHTLAKVCDRELGASLDKSQQTSNWSRRQLDSEQLRYAALDAEVLLTLHHRFIALQSVASSETGRSGGASRP